LLIQHRVRVPIGGEPDVALACHHALDFAANDGLSTLALQALVTAVSEIAQSIADHVGGGEVTFAALEDGDRRGVAVTARGAGLVQGVAGARRLADEFELIAGAVTTVVNLKKWADAPVYGTPRWRAGT
jgi:anti-sigma regulatory factor (Ser/Thr protein kinase)